MPLQTHLLLLQDAPREGLHLDHLQVPPVWVPQLPGVPLPHPASAAHGIGSRSITPPNKITLFIPGQVLMPHLCGGRVSSRQAGHRGGERGAWLAQWLVMLLREPLYARTLPAAHAACAATRTYIIQYL